MDAMTLNVPSHLVGNVTILSSQKVNATWHAQMESLTLEKPAILAQIQVLAALTAKNNKDGHALQQHVPNFLLLDSEYVEYYEIFKNGKYGNIILKDMNK